MSRITPAGDGSLGRDRILSHVSDLPGALEALGAVAGGTIAGHIPDFQTVQDFRRQYFGPCNQPLLRGSCWETLEHGSFWLGVFFVIVAFVIS